MSQHIKKEDEIDLRQLTLQLSRKWYYFLISAALFAVLAFLYIKLTLPVYESRSSILVKDSRNKSNNIQDYIAGDLFGNSKNLATEIGILQSHSVLMETIQELKLDVAICSEETFFSKPLYKNAPFDLSQTIFSEAAKDISFYIDITEENSYQLSVDDHSSDGAEIKMNRTVRWGEKVSNRYFSFVLEKNKSFFSKGSYSFTIRSINFLLRNYAEQLKVDALNKDATIVVLTFRDQSPELAKDFLNTLGQAYINRDISDKSSVAALTLRFVEEQLNGLSKTLGGIEQELQKFKEENGTVNLSEESKAYLEKVNSIDTERAKAELELKSMDYLYDYVQKNKNLEELSPATIGTPDPVLIDLITKLKSLENKKYEMGLGNSKDNPLLVTLNEQIEVLRKSIIENIKTNRENLNLRLKNIYAELNSNEGNIRKVPLMERELIAIQRNFEVNENIYLYLLQKKAETGIAKATAVSDNKLLDNASLLDRPVIPNKKAVAVIAFLLAFILPAIWIGIHAFVSNTINSRNDIERLTKVPIIGIVGHLRKEDKMVVAQHPKSSIAEAFRSIRANLMFFGLSEKNKVVLITSTVGSEGKSFTSLNLASVLALQNYKVVIVGMDLRKPQLFKEAGIDNDLGVSNYLIGQHSLKEIIKNSNLKNLDIIPSGPVPPNPAELLNKNETGKLIEELRQAYDYIIIDTPPVGIVSDALSLVKYSDINIFILRENYSRKDYLKAINEYYANNNIPNLCLLLNDAGTNKQYGYGYGYNYHGYGYYDDEKKR